MKRKQQLNKILTSILFFVLIFGSFNYIIFYQTNAFYSDQAKTTALFTASDNIEDYCPPNTPTLINPKSGETKTATNVQLQVKVMDPNNDPMNVSFYDAATNECLETKTNVESNSIVSAEWNNLEFGTTYSWYVTATDWEGSTTSETWNFTTDYKPEFSQLLSPENNSDNLNLSPTLSINVSDRDDETLNVTFYDNQSNVIDTCTNINHIATITWNNLSYSTTYSWYTMISDDITQTRSPTFTFTTMNAPSEPNTSPDPSSNPDSSPSNPNTPPTAAHNGPYTANISEPILFNATESIDEDGRIQSYHWDFEDNTIATNKTVEKSYTTPGNYTVTLTVTDNDGSSDTITTTAFIHGITITNLQATPPVQKQNQTVNISCTISHSHPLEQVNISITYPNQTTTTLQMNKNNSTQSTYYLNQTYNQTGSYNYTITIKDTINKTKQSKTQVFTIYQSTPPTVTNITILPNPQQKNNTVTITAHITSIPAIQTATITIHSSNNTIETNQMMYDPNTAVYTYSTLFNQTGNYTFYIQATNTDNLSTQTINQTIHIINDTTPPTITNITVQPGIQDENHPIQITSTITDNLNLKIAFINITHPNNNTTQHFLNNTNSTTYEFEKTFEQYGNYTFAITAIDTCDNTNISTPYSFIITDLTSPIIKNITTQQINQTINVTADITDNTNVNNVSINITYPDNSTVKNTMTKDNNSIYFYNNTFQPGNYSYIIYATDAYENYQQSIIKTFTIQ